MDHRIQGLEQKKTSAGGNSVGYDSATGGRGKARAEIREELVTISASLKPLADDGVKPLAPQQLIAFSQEMGRRLDEEIAHSGSERLRTWRDKLFAGNPRAERWMVVAVVVGILVLLAAAIFYATLQAGPATATGVAEVFSTRSSYAAPNGDRELPFMVTDDDSAGRTGSRAESAEV